jgi:hypothetical protein
MIILVELTIIQLFNLVNLMLVICLCIHFFRANFLASGLRLILLLYSGNGVAIDLRLDVNYLLIDFFSL